MTKTRGSANGRAILQLREEITMLLRPPLSVPGKGTYFFLMLSVLAIALTTNSTLFAVETNSEKAKAARQEALAKQRRVFFNDDTYELDREDANTPEGFLKRRLAPLAGRHVDVISWSVLGGWADAPVYDSKIQPIYGDAHGGPPKSWGRAAQNLKAMIKGGRCPLQIVIDFAHGNGMETFASIRMNDCHDSFLPSGITLWKKEHPEFWVDSTGIPHDKDQHHLGLYYTAQDFTHKEVRDRKFEIIEEVCQRYDIDGIDLNFMRHPVFFSRTMRDEAVTDVELKIMTDLVRRIRRRTDERGLQRGRPILVAAIVPDSLRLSKNVGLDIETWIQEDLIDIVVPGLGYAPFSLPVEEFARVAHKYGVKVYPCINRQAPHKVPEDLVSEGFRGVVANWYAAGADGVFFWNLGTPFEYKKGAELAEIRSRYYAALPELGSPRTLRGKDKLFCLDNWILEYYRHVCSRPPLPVELKPGESEQVTLVAADDLQAAAHEGQLENLRLTIGVTGLEEKRRLVLRLNGQELLGGEAVSKSKGKLQINYAVQAPLLKQDENVLKASLKVAPDASAKPVKLTLVRLLVRYRDNTTTAGSR